MLNLSSLLHALNSMKVLFKRRKAHEIIIFFRKDRGFGLCFSLFCVLVLLLLELVFFFAASLRISLCVHIDAEYGKSIMIS